MIQDLSFQTYKEKEQAPTRALAFIGAFFASRLGWRWTWKKSKVVLVECKGRILAHDVMIIVVNITFYYQYVNNPWKIICQMKNCEI